MCFLHWPPAKKVSSLKWVNTDFLNDALFSNTPLDSVLVLIHMTKKKIF